EEAVLAFAGEERGALADQRRRGFMLDPMPPLADVDEELVLLQRQPAEERRLRADDSAQRLEVLLEVVAVPNDQMNARAALDEGVPRHLGRGDHWRVDEMVVVAGQKDAVV